VKLIEIIHHACHTFADVFNITETVKYPNLAMTSKEKYMVFTSEIEKHKMNKAGTEIICNT